MPVRKREEGTSPGFLLCVDLLVRTHTKPFSSDDHGRNDAFGNYRGLDTNTGPITQKVVKMLGSVELAEVSM